MEVLISHAMDRRTFSLMRAFLANHRRRSEIKLLEHMISECAALSPEGQFLPASPCWGRPCLDGQRLLQANGRLCETSCKLGRMRMVTSCRALPGGQLPRRGKLHWCMVVGQATSPRPSVDLVSNELLVLIVVCWLFSCCVFVLFLLFGGGGGSWRCLTCQWRMRPASGQWKSNLFLSEAQLLLSEARGVLLAFVSARTSQDRPSSKRLWAQR